MQPFVNFVENRLHMAQEEEYDELGTFRDRVSTIAEDGKRVWLYPRKPKGKLYNYRTILAWILLAIFFILPFLRYQGDPLILFNFADRKFIIFGVMFYPQDFHLFVLSMIAFIVFIVLFTVVYGRIFCGWLCPQTVFMEFLYRPLEQLIEGNSASQQRLDASPLNFNKLWRKTLKHILFFIISFLFITFLLAYIIGMDQVLQAYKEGIAQHPFGFAGLLFFTILHYLVFAKMREQVCIIICPYGRLQGVLLDRNSILVSYDHVRGEPRGKKTVAGPGENTSGDCIDCFQCVSVCPTGIDIRNGVQLECINCTACIDACNSVMGKVNKPKGLIRYASERSISDKQPLKFNVRIAFYSTVLLGLLSLIIYLFTIRTDIEPTLLRMKGTIYQEYDSTHISNLYKLQVINKTRIQANVDVVLESPKARIEWIGPKISVGKGEVGVAQFMVVMDKADIHSSNTKVEFEVTNNGKKTEEIKSTFMAPDSFDR